MTKKIGLIALFAILLLFVSGMRDFTSVAQAESVGALEVAGIGSFPLPDWL